MPRRTLAIIGVLILAAVAVASAILFYQLRARRITPIRPETPEATSEGIIWNAAITCEGGNVSLSTKPDWQSILILAEVNPSSWTWGNQTSITVQGHIAWQFPGDAQPYHEYPTKTFDKPADCPGTTPTPIASGTPTPSPSVTPRPSVTPSASPTPTVTTTASPTASVTPTVTPTATPPIGGLPTPTPGTVTTPAPTPVPTLPPAGTTTPTILIIGGGILMLLVAFAFAL